MNNISFETTLNGRVSEMLDACTKCGKCVEVCPSVRPAGISEASSMDIISGVLDIVRDGDGADGSRKWAKSCMLSGECIEACDYGVNPRFLLAMARVSLARRANELRDRRRHGVEKFRDLSRDVTILSRLQLDVRCSSSSDKVLHRHPIRARPRTSYSTPDVMYSRRRILRCSRSTLWTRSASRIE